MDIYISIYITIYFVKYDVILIFIENSIKINIKHMEHSNPMYIF